VEVKRITESLPVPEHRLLISDAVCTKRLRNLMIPNR